MKNGVITISRQFGSGGHEIGVKLAKELGIKLYDKELVELIAKNGKMDADFVAANDEKYIPPMYPVLHGGFALPVFYQSQPTDQIYKEQAKLIKELAASGPCVVIGRCADYILRDMRPVNCFVYGSEAQRIKRKMSMIPAGVEMKPEDMKRRLKEVDKQRSRYHSFYTERKWGDPVEYDICISTDRIGVDGAVKVIKEYCEAARIF